jgi:hypothetical protein
MRVGTAIAIVLLLVLPAVAFADPGHGAEQPHLNAPQSSPNTGGDSSTLLIIATLATLVIFAVCAVLLKQAQQRRD